MNNAIDWRELFRPRYRIKHVLENSTLVYKVERRQWWNWYVPIGDFPTMARAAAFVIEERRRDRLRTPYKITPDHKIG